jgi:Major intrinsic protein
MPWGIMAGAFEGSSMNPAGSFGPDLAIGDLSTWQVYPIGPVASAVGVAYVLRGPAKAEEAGAAQGYLYTRTPETPVPASVQRTVGLERHVLLGPAFCQEKYNTSLAKRWRDKVAHALKLKGLVPSG